MSFESKYRFQSPRNWPLVALVCTSLMIFGCPSGDTTPGDADGEPPIAKLTAQLSMAEPPMLNVLKSGEECGEYKQEELKEPVQIHPIDGVLETQLVVGMRRRCVPVFEGNAWTMQALNLRTYGHPDDHSIPITEEMVRNNPDDPNIVWTAPGPTLVLHTPTPEQSMGSRFVMDLFNILEPEDDPHACEPIHKTNSDFEEPVIPGTAPNCFHGNNSTNFHFHGFHISPQPHQDFVGLELLPYGSEMPTHAIHTRGSMAIGTYDFNVDPLPPNQAPGTHWYHAHKHGSTALQVLNGLVGTFKVLGTFDEELESLFTDQGGLEDRLLVVQQLQETLPGLGGVHPPPSPLINGQANPILTMQPGEIQRWRFVGATMQASAQLLIKFLDVDGDRVQEPEFRQIAMDGVQFAPENYDCQPLINGPRCQSEPQKAFKLPPGNRIDVLVKAPDTPGRHVMTYKMIGNFDPTVAEPMAARAKAKVDVLLGSLAGFAEAADDASPPLLTVEVVGEPVQQAFPNPCLPGQEPQDHCFPRLPAFLDDLEGPFEERTVGYQMANPRNLYKVQFSINDTPYCPSCANETLELDVEEEWTLTNNSDIAHPFHIHVNPFQVIRSGDKVYNPPYIWQDVIPIPTGTPTNLGEAVIRYVARDFTGEFVNHCHILGHEDRGMMHNVQAVCPGQTDKWGKPTPSISDPECVEGNLIDAAPQCPDDGTCPGYGSSDSAE